MVFTSTYKYTHKKTAPRASAGVATSRAEWGRHGLSEVRHGVGIGADKRDFLQGHLANVETAFRLEQADMDDDAAEFDGRRGMAPRFDAADRGAEPVEENGFDLVVDAVSGGAPMSALEPTPDVQ